MNVSDKMSNQLTTTKETAEPGNSSLSEYAAAEERLLDYFSPSTIASANDAGVVDPSRDNIVPFISENSDIVSLLSSPENSFKGFNVENDEEENNDNNAAGGDQALVFGVHLSADNRPSCRKAINQLSPEPAALLEDSTNMGYILTNGNEPHEEQEDQNAQCVIYEENVMLLDDDQCCEIILDPDQGIERTYLLGIQSQQQQVQHQQQLNGATYNCELLPAEEEEEHELHASHVYLSDAALVPQQQQLLLDAEEEEVQQISDPYVDERPDICEVSDDELEEHDVDHQPADEEEQALQVIHATAVPIPRSSTTEFPVSSTSMPNGSDNDDFDDEMGTVPTEDHSPPQRRKFAGLLKNTLAADAMDRRLANICQSQPQMSVNEKLANWNCDHHCDVVEDVENFEAEFERHEAEPAIQPNFNEFYDGLRQGLTKLTNEFNQSSQNEDLTVHKRPSYRRLLQHPTPVETVDVDMEPEPILLDDDDDDDDCFEVQITPSAATLVEQKTPMNNQETQTVFELSQSKKTSTTDLVNDNITHSVMPTIAENERNLPNTHAETLVIEEQHLETEEKNCQILEHQMEEIEQEELPEEIVRSDSTEDIQRHAHLYQQQEFCNYLGLTELATANAVAIAMRELANSTVARRSLRVRTQQQMDRMRSDVRGKRRQRQQQQQDELPHHGEQQQMEEHQHNLTDEKANRSISSINANGSVSNNISSSSSSSSSSRTSLNVNQETSSMHTHEYTTTEKIGFVYCPPQKEANISLQKAFAKVYAAAAPTHCNLHESIQDRLRQARESKPSIYIVKTVTNNGLPKARQSPVMEAPQSNRKTPEYEANKSQVVKKTPRKLPKKTAKRRRTTAGGTAASTSAAQAPERELITRSMNSKMLRNRKVNMLKKYELSDLAVPTRSKHRLSGGTITNSKRLKGGKKTEKKLEPSERESELLSQLHQIKINEYQMQKQEEQRQEDSSKAMLKTEIGKSHRAKSLPPDLDTSCDLPQAKSDSTADVGSAIKPLTWINTDQAMVAPPSNPNTARRYLNLLRKSREQPLQNSSSWIASEPYTELVPISPPPSHRMPHFSRRPQQLKRTEEERIQHSIQMAPPGSVLSLTTSTTTLRNPLAGKYGKVLHVFYELDQLIVAQERFVSFWKYSKILGLLQSKDTGTEDAATPKSVGEEFAKNAHTGRSDKLKGSEQCWVYLGGLRRTTNDIEIPTPYVNRLCAHNSTPIYIEMHSHPLDHHRRESNLLSLYVKVYYYCEEEMRPKIHSVHLDAVNCEPHNVIYTCIAESRYFVMAFQQDTMMGKSRTGICKYSLTPTLDTLASIREFKQLRHELRHIECLTEDRLIGYGMTRITIWDHRSGDTLMNYDFGFPIGSNLGVMHLPNFEMDQNSMLVLYQHNVETSGSPELRIIACELSHTNPSHRVLHVHSLPSPQFDSQLIAVNTGDHLILKSQSDAEIWISTSDLRQLTYVAPQHTQRFYSHQKSQIITLTPETLTVDSITNHILKIATQQLQSKMHVDQNIPK